MPSLFEELFEIPSGPAAVPENQNAEQNVRTREKYAVNFAHTVSYGKSAVPYCQNLLNLDHRTREAAARTKEDARAKRKGGG